MRIWDINVAYLNRQSLLGEHRELHGMVSIIRNNKKGYSKHPETLRWINHIDALIERHDQIVREMELRGYNHKSPLFASGNIIYPYLFIDTPAQQFEILRKKYIDKEQGRIFLPKTSLELLEQYKLYIIPNIENALYSSFSQQIALGNITFEQLALKLVLLERSNSMKGKTIC